MMTTQQATASEQIIDRHDRYMTINYGRYPIAMVRGEGSRLWDAEGREYLDLFSGFGAGILGHCHPDLVEAVTQQAKLLWHPGNLLHSEPQTHLAQAIHRHGFGGRSFFCHSGADANEAAFKLARLFGRAHPGKQGKRHKIIAALQSFHGRTFGTMVATGQPKVREGFEPLLTGFSHVPYNDLQAMQATIDQDTVAIVVEPIQGEGGCVVPADTYLPELRNLADAHNLLLIFDEVWTGCGRTGRYFAHQHWQVEPDIMTLAKGVGGGLAVGVMCAKPHVAELFDHRRHGAVAHATTLGGNCLSMAVAARIFAVLERDGLVAHAQRLGRHVRDRLQRFATEHPVVTEVRGKGLFLGIQLDPARSAGRFANASDVVKVCLDRGLLVNATQSTVLRIAPSLTISPEELDQGLDILEKVLDG
jgi:acetylornithine/N-succinyldiaminopimelate aminotransferase